MLDFFFAASDHLSLKQITTDEKNKAKHTAAMSMHQKLEQELYRFGAVSIHIFICQGKGVWMAVLKQHTLSQANAEW